MFFHGTHAELVESIEAIGAGFAVYEYLHAGSAFQLVSCNTLYEEILGKDRRQVLNQSLLTIFPRYIGQPMYETFIKCKAEQIAIESEILVDYKGEERYWRSIVSPILEKKDGSLRIIQTCVEITEKKQLERKLSLSMKRFEAVVKSAYDGIISVNEHPNISLFNDAASQIFGYQSSEVLGEALTKLLPQKYRKNHTG